MKKVTKVFVGIATLWPLAYGLFVPAYVLMKSLSPSSGHQYIGLFDSPSMALLGVATHVMGGTISLGVFVAYLIFIHKTNLIPPDKKIRWTVLLFAGSVLTMPVVFLTYIWREPEAR